MRTLVILNPAAGGRADTDILRGRLESRIEGEYVCTSEVGEAASLSAEAARAGYDAVIAAGGDGTVREVATGLYRGGGGPRLGIVPAGTGNDLAFSLGIPPVIEEAATVATGERTAALDLVRASRPGGEEHPQFLANAAVAGFGGRIGDSMSPLFRRRLRPIAYPVAALGQIRDLRPYAVRLVIDGETIDVRAFMVILANGEYAGGRIRFAPGASTHDGLLDLVVVHAVGPVRLAGLVPRVLAGRHTGHPGVSLYRATSVQLHSETDMWINLDGDTWQPGPATFEVVAAALRVAVP